VRAFGWIGAAYAAALLVALAVGAWGDWSDPLAVAFAADLAATLVVFGFSVAFNNSSFYDAYWSVAPPVLALYFAAQALAGGERRPAGAGDRAGLRLGHPADRRDLARGARRPRAAALSPRRSPRQAILATGVWAWSRHPNYVGEMGFWWGLWLFGVAAAPAWWWITRIGPVAITLLFRFASLPLIEARMLARRPAYAERQRRVSMVVPWPFPRAQG